MVYTDVCPECGAKIQLYSEGEVAEDLGLEPDFLEDSEADT